MPIGNPLFIGDVIVGELSYSLFEILDNLGRGERICFIDDNLERQLDTVLLIPFNGR